ncbi:MAG TPA: iron-containing alcohol dehydrogenase, partial [Polyangiaceae bacterium]|nr:iron-containing alcohol dehydrogenase [Polyangiaceae bacterium]
MNDAAEPSQRSLDALPELVRRAGGHKVLLITGPSARHAERVTRLLAPLEVELFAGARRHVPEDVLAEAARVLDASGADVIVALGGGSAIGLGKALVLTHPLPFIAVPTTYSGSEQTSLYGTTKDGTKKTGRDPRVRPLHVIYDPALTEGTPKALSVTSLVNALAHPIARLASKNAPEDQRERALRAIAVVFGALEALVEDPNDARARVDAQRGAALAAEVLEGGELGAHHALVHRLGGAFDLDHAALHSVLLPHGVHRLRSDAPDALAAVETRLHVADLEAALFDLLLRAGASTSLKALGVELAKFDGLLEATDERDRALLRAAFHGRRPSACVRLENFGLRELVSVRGPAFGEARRVVVALHGRNATADSVIGRVLEIVGSDPDVTVVAPQATNLAWYSAPYTKPRAELGAALETALGEVNAVLDRVLAATPHERVALFGFSQGACLALELFLRRGERLSALVALSGAIIGPPGEQPSVAAGVVGTPIVLGGALADPYLEAGSVERTAAALSAAGCAVTLEMAPGTTHTFHARQRLAARELLSGRAPPPEPAGFGNVLASEALPGAFPRAQNTPRHAPYNLHGELVSGTAFTAPRAENSRVWLYRLRPSAQQREFRRLAHPTLGSDFEGEPALANLTGFAPLPLPSAPTDFVDGLYTLGGAGSARLRRGYAVHLYAANRNMEDRAFYDADGDLLLLPELGALTLLTELGALEVKPGELALVPRGLRFTVILAGPAARGYVAEVFGRRFTLPERGPLGSNGLADARHFRAPAAWYEDRLAVGYRITAKVGGVLQEATQDRSPYDVVAWHGNHCPYVYDLSLFTPAGYTRIDHPDPSIYTVVSAPMDEAGAHSLDLVVFPPRWDATEHTFRLPYFHRNATTEINGIVREISTNDGMFEPGCVFVSPCMTPHGVVAASIERHLAQTAEQADRPHRYSDRALWFQFETALPLTLTPWAEAAAGRHADWHARWGVYRSRFTPDRPRG